jgi:hypothetical protein
VPLQHSPSTVQGSPVTSSGHVVPPELPEPPLLELLLLEPSHGDEHWLEMHWAKVLNKSTPFGYCVPHCEQLALVVQLFWQFKYPLQSGSSRQASPAWQHAPARHAPHPAGAPSLLAADATWLQSPPPPVPDGVPDEPCDPLAPEPPIAGPPMLPERPGPPTLPEIPGDPMPPPTPGDPTPPLIAGAPGDPDRPE